jgi:hypothetical protein
MKLACNILMVAHPGKEQQAMNAAARIMGS